ncbi:hypothetical protein PFISCL1PPCAC_13312, partial [Pristionchus fissidentatus]
QRRGVNEEKYSLARTYQLRENITIMRMMKRLAIPFAVFTTPATLFYALYLLPPTQFALLKCFSVAMFDWWLTALSLAISLCFPLFDFRFRRAAREIPCFRMLMPSKRDKSLSRFATKHATVDRQRATDLYFDFLEMDLDLGRRPK